MQFNGAPVIFVPGNSGSYKQARSFASVALRKGIEQNWLKHLDYFTGNFKMTQDEVKIFETLNHFTTLCPSQIIIEPFDVPLSIDRTLLFFYF